VIGRDRESEKNGNDCESETQLHSCGASCYFASAPAQFIKLRLT
jgi:hypothetical protein